MNAASVTTELPSSPESEYGVIGCCLAGGLEVTLEAVEKLTISSLILADCQEAFSVLEQMATAGQEISPMHFVQAWRVRKGDARAMPPEAILHSVEQIPSPENLGYYIADLLDKHTRRKIILFADGMTNKACRPDMPVEALVAEFEAFLNRNEVGEDIVLGGKELAQRLMVDLERRMELKGALSGIGTGLIDFDHLTEGLQPGEQTIIAARPSQGKTALALTVVAHACMSNKIPTLVISLEMSTTAITRRLMSCCSRIPMRNLRNGTFNEHHMASIPRFNQEMNRSNLYIAEGITGLNANRIASLIRRHVRKHGVKLVVIDYLQKIKAPTRQEKRTYEVGEVSGILKSIAVETNVSMLTIAQLNRECEKDKGRSPRLSDLSDSAQIERDGDTIALLSRNSRDDNSSGAKLFVAKQRDGEVGIVNLEFDGQHCRFLNASKQSEPQQNQQP